MKKEIEWLFLKLNEINSYDFISKGDKKDFEKVLDNLCHLYKLNPSEFNIELINKINTIKKQFYHKKCNRNIQKKNAILIT